MEPTLTGLAERIDVIVAGTDTFFLLLGAILVLFMHAGFAFLEVEPFVTKTKSTRL